MSRIDDILAENRDMLDKGISSGRPKDETMAKLLANHVEASALVLGELTQFKDDAKSYADSSHRFARSARLFSAVSLGVALLAVGLTVWLNIRSDNSNQALQQQQVYLLQQIHNDLNP